MIGTLERSPFIYRRLGLRARPFELVGAAILRYGLVLFLVLFGLAKFTNAEAQTIHPRVANSPLLGSLGAILGFLMTLSFTTPGLSPETQGFLMNDLLLVGAAVWTAGDSLRAVERGRV